MDPSLLQRIVQDLEHHPECDRIKKLLHWVCTDTWCQDPQSLSVGPLITGLVAKVSTQNSLQALLLEGAQQLNKKKKYTQIGQMISQILTPIYPIAPSAPPLPLPTPQVQVQKPVQQSSFAPPAADYDMFEVRLAVFKYTVPLKAKILMSAVLDQQVLLQPKHWLMLKQSSLDEQLRRLYQAHSSFAELEQNLTVAAGKLVALEQIGQVVEAVGQAFKPLYQKQSPSVLAPSALSSMAVDSLSGDLDDMISVILSPEAQVPQESITPKTITREDDLSTQCWPSVGENNGR